MTDWVVFDFDGTLCTNRSGWTVLAALFGTESESLRRKQAYFDGEMSFDERIERDVRAWRQYDVTKSDVERAAEAVKLMPGTESMLRKLDESGFEFGVLSAGVADLTAKIERFDPAFIVGNELHFENGLLADGETKVSATSKTNWLAKLGAEHGFDPAEITYIGDSNTDIEPFKLVERAILFNPDPALDPTGHEAADVVRESQDLSDLESHF
ncbi:MULTISPECIES: HAD family hydrolase [Haloarcula]|uniref:HAD family hydrolase n=1 Tax=Haloarcula TaxID=2237 RepID=UPI0023ECBC62|nr:HAD family phosphatase [Halomicroarcula sp. XH51]